MGSFNDEDICGRCHKSTDSFGHASPNICSCRDSEPAPQPLPTPLSPPKPARITAQEWQKRREEKLRKDKAANEAAADQCIDRFMLLIQGGQDPWKEKGFIDLEGECTEGVAALVCKYLTGELHFRTDVTHPHGTSFPACRVRVFRPSPLG